jgi:elongation factor G
LLEQLYEYSDEMMELALSEAEIPASLVRKVLRAATIQQLVQPVLCGSALHGIGVQPVLDAVESYLPNPIERPPVEGKAVATGRKSASDEVITRKPDVSEPFCALVFKVLPAKTGDIAWARVYSGQLKANSRVYNPGKDKKDNVAQLWQIRAQAKDRDGQIDEVSTGDIVGIIGLRHSITGDTLCDAAAPLLLETIEFPDTVISMAIEPENATERDKLADTLEMLQRQDPTLEIIEGDTGQTLMRGMGELHLEVVKNRLLREFKLNVKFHQPQVSYRETINAGVTVVGECNRLINGVQKFAKITMLVEPDENVATGCAVRSQLEPGALTGELLEVMFDELNSCGSSGGNIAGFPLMGIRATVRGVETMEEVTDDMAIRIAINDAFDKGLTQGNPVLLEPIMKLSVSTPEQYLGDFVGDLQQRRGIIVHTENHGDRTDILANAPLKELFGYSSAMRSLSQGRASCSMEPLEYAAAPPEHAKEFTF